MPCAAAMQRRRAGVIGTAPAGHPFAGTVGAGEAVRIFTGGVVPDGADAIVIQEDAQPTATWFDFERRAPARAITSAPPVWTSRRATCWRQQGAG